MLHTLAAGLAERFDVTDLHLYGLDGAGGGLAAMAALPHCGAVVGRDETSRGERLLARLAGELERRQRLLAHGGLGSHQEQRRAAPIDERLPWMVLLVDGWEGLVAAYESVDHGRPLDTLLRLVREGAAVGLRVVMTGDRAALTSRAGSAFRDRLVLRLADPADYALAGISPRQVPDAMPAGRALVWPAVQEAQLAVLDVAATGAGQGRALAAVAARPGPGSRRRSRTQASCRCGSSRCRPGSRSTRWRPPRRPRAPDRGGLSSVSAVTSCARAASTWTSTARRSSSPGRPAAVARPRWRRWAAGCSARAAAPS